MRTASCEATVSRAGKHGQRRSEMKKINYAAGEMSMCPGHNAAWLGAHGDWLRSGNDRAEVDREPTTKAALPRERFSPVAGSSEAAKRIDYREPHEVLLVVGYDDAIVSFGGSRDHHIERAAWLTMGRALSHESRPDQPSRLVERKHTPGEEGLRPLRTRKPALQFAALLARGFFQHASIYLRHGKGRDEQVLVRLTLHPGDQSFRRRWLRDVADDVRIE